MGCNSSKSVSVPVNNSLVNQQNQPVHQESSFTNYQQKDVSKQSVHIQQEEPDFQRSQELVQYYHKEPLNHKEQEQESSKENQHATSGNQEYVKLTIKEIAEKNTRERNESVLVPIFGKIYDIKQMYDLISSMIFDIDDIDTEDASSQLSEIKTPQMTSSYVRLTATLKCIGIKQNILDELKLKCLKGELLHESIQQQQADFQEGIKLTLYGLKDNDDEEDENNSTTSSFKSDTESMIAHERNRYIWNTFVTDHGLWAMEFDCKKLMKRKIVFQDKLFEPLIEYQDKVQFPLPLWRKPIEMREFLQPPYYRKNRKYVDKYSYSEGEIKSMLTAIKEEMLDYNKNLQEQEKLLGESKADETNKQLLILRYHINYSTLALKSCDSQIDEYTLTRKPVFKVDDINRNIFPLPKYSHAEELRLFLENWSPFDLELPLDGYAWVHLLPDLITRDVPTEAQLQLIESRQGREGLNDESNRKKRREKLVNYFEKKYEMEIKLPFIHWTDTLEKSFQDFQDVCEGRKEPCIRKPIDKKVFAEERYQFLVSGVKLITDEERAAMSCRRETILNKFAQRYGLTTDIKEMYKGWANRLEENQKCLLELCDKNEEIEKQIKERNPQNYFQVIFVPYGILG